MMASNGREKLQLPTNAAPDTDEMPLQQQEEETEISQYEALKSLLTDDELSDLTLRGLDGVEVLANRCLLASRSPVFRRMLFGKFKEASNDTIDLGYDGAILQAIVNYIYTNEIPAAIIQDSSDDEAGDVEWDISMVQCLVTLVEASNYFALPEARRKLEEAAKKHMNKHHELVVLILAVCGDSNKALQDSALDMVRQNPGIIVNCKKNLISMIRPSTLEKIIKDDQFPLDEFSLFQILQSWANAEENEKINDTAPLTTTGENSRKRIAAELTSHIHLENIDAKELSTTVSASGLVTPEQLSEAYKTQALSARSHLGPVYKRRRRSVWMSSKTTIFEYNGETNGGVIHTEILDCPVLRSGVHKWSIKVLEGGDHLEIGVLSSSWPINPNNYLYAQRGGWSFWSRRSSGTVGHALDHSNDDRLINRFFRNGLPLFSTGSTISFTLNLVGEGVLTASIDGTSSFELFTGMLEANRQGGGFLPAISASDDGPDGLVRAEFLGFERLA